MTDLWEWQKERNLDRRKAKSSSEILALRALLDG